MRRAIVVALLLASVIFFTIGCSLDVKSGGALEVGAVNLPNIVSDKSGGAYAVYQVYLAKSEINQFYLQRISPEGTRLWGEKGVLIGEASGNLDVGELQVLADDNGDAITAWCDWWNDVMNVVKVNPQGDILWQKALDDVEYASHIISDGKGGIICIVADSGIQRRDAEGNLLWNRPNFLFQGSNTDRSIVSDGFGGAFVLTIGRGSEKSVYAQRIDGEGNCPWNQETVSIFYQISEEASARITTDGTEGAFVVWLERDPDALNFPEYHISVLRLSEVGEVLWQKHDFLEELVGYDMFVVTDNNDNALVCWEYAAGLGAQAISPEGELLWSGYEREYRLDGFSYNVVAGGYNGAIIGACSMYDERSLKAQIIDESGRALFAEGVALSDDDQVHSWQFIIAADGEDGALFAWGSSENVYSVEHSSVQRLSDEGELLWGNAGIRLDDWN